MRTYQLDLQPIGLRIPITEEMTILDAAQEAGVEIMALCGGEGWCGKCKVQLMEGELSPPHPIEKEVLSEQELLLGMRLACQARVKSDTKLNLPPESLNTSQRLQTEGNELFIEPDPMITLVEFNLSPPTVDDLDADALRLQKALEKQGYPHVTVQFPLLGQLSTLLRENKWHANAVIRNQNEVIMILPVGKTPLGFAVDIGTTKIAGYLVDLLTGETLTKSGVGNPQIPYGEDVVSRIQYVNQHENGGQILQERLIERLNDLIQTLCEQVGASPTQIVDSVFVGNTVIHHLFLGIPVTQLGEAPYVAAISDAIERKATQMGLTMAPGAYLYMPPNIAGYVGADHTSMLLATEAVERAQRDKQTIIALDIGTNTEISLAYDGRLLSCSCASGPAFEGAHITNGMRAMPGAIERIRIDQDIPILKTIENAAPIGICGSGILDGVAELSRNQIINQNGQMNPDAPGVEVEGRRHRQYRLVSAEQSGTGSKIVISRKDVNEIQLAKGAIRAGVEVLLREAGINAADIDVFIIAGAFGTYLDLENAVEIGMFPDLPIDTFEQVGNAAGIGAKHLLLSRSIREKSKRMIEHDEYVELTAYPGFREIYVDALLFP
ncbi:MAG: ASKHA domain-containing protein [Anaerolineae bacterium]|jgi:uncharacterized 2Fe-2S/4Fe-4S cluster protein (DUF4445 family)|nr:ASKHA domain-containing protein [Anaerolineae bacterium]